MDHRLILTREQARVVYELINWTGVESTEIPFELGSQSLEDLVQQDIGDDINVRRVAHSVFDQLEEAL
jgi:hypothetical protein